MAVRRTAGWGIAQRFVDDRQHAFEIRIYVVIPEPQHPETLVSEMQIARRIASRVRIVVMLSAINFDDQTMFQARKIDDKIITRRLATKVKAAFAPRSKVNPKLHLLRCHLFAKAPRDFVRHSPHPASLRSAILPLRGRDKQEPRLRL